MREYLMTLIAVSLLSGIVGMITPEGDLKKYVRLATALCLLCAMIGPGVALWRDSETSIEDLLGEIQGIGDVNYDEIYNEALISGGERQAAVAIQSNLLKEFDLSDDSLEVIVSIGSKNNNEKTVDVTVLLREEAIFADPREILAFVESMGELRCTVIYD